MKFIIDSRMRKKEKEYLSNFGELFEIKPQSVVYDEISAHPDIFFTKINEKIFVAPNLEADFEIMAERGEEQVGSIYPNDVKYNICQLGKYVIHNFKFTDAKVLKFIESSNLEKIQVNQGYSKCSIALVTNNSCITSDDGICKALRSKGIDCLLVKENKINLLDRKGSNSKMSGFIGGASCIIDDKFVLFGDSKYLENKVEIYNFLKVHNMTLIDFKNLELNDYGGVIIL